MLFPGKFYGRVSIHMQKKKKLILNIKDIWCYLYVDCQPRGFESKFYMYNYYVSILGKPKLWSFVIGKRHCNNLDLCCLLLLAKSLCAHFKILSKTVCIRNWVKTIVLNINSHFNDNSCVLLVVTDQENMGQLPLVER